jgi:hypothetical protein
MSYTITPEQHAEINASITKLIAPKIGTKVWLLITYGTVNASIYGLLTKTTGDSGWDYRLILDDHSTTVFNVEDCYSVLNNTIFLGTR